MYRSGLMRLLGAFLASAAILTAANASAQEEEEKANDEPADEAPKAEPPTPKPIDETPKPATFPTYTPAKGFRLESDDGNYVLRFRFAAGIKYEPVWNEGDATNNGMLSFIRPSLGGHFYKPWIGYSVAFELASETPFLLAGNIDLTPIEAFNATFGQHSTPVSRHTSFGVRNIFFADFSSVSSYFWSGRQKGMTLYGGVLDGKVDYWAGLYGGSPTRETTSDPHNYIVEGRATISPFGASNSTELPFTSDGQSLPPRVSFTVQGYHGKMQRAKENVDPTISPLDPQQTLLLQTMSTGGADLWLQWGRFILFGEYFLRYLGSRTGLPGHNAQGAWGQLIANAYDQKIGVGARVGWIDPSNDVTKDHVFEAEGQVAWFIHAPELVLKLRYAYVHQQTPNAAEQAFIPLPFAPGTTHLGTLQVTLSF